MRAAGLLLGVLLALPVVAQDASEAPEPAPEETAAAIAAVEAANLSDAAYRALWCAGLYSQKNADALAAAEPGVAQEAANSRETLYRKAAVELLASGLTETQFTAIAENVYVVVQSQTRVGGTARDFTDDECTAAAAP